MAKPNRRVTIDTDKNQSVGALGSRPDKRSNSVVPLKKGGGGGGSANFGSILAGNNSSSSSSSVHPEDGAGGSSADLLRLNDSSMSGGGGAGSTKGKTRCGSPLPAYSPSMDGKGPYNADGLRSAVSKTHIVDYSYLDIESIESMAATEPRAGKQVKKKQKDLTPQELAALEAKGEGAVVDKKKVQDMSNRQLFFGGTNGKTMRTDDGFMVMRAKEETYAFKDGGDDPHLADKDMKHYHLDTNGNLVKRDERELQREAALEANVSARRLYHCSHLKLNNNLLESIDTLVSTLYTVTLRPFMNMTILDLSCNQIKTLPALPAPVQESPNKYMMSNNSSSSSPASSNLALAELPLQTLLLHQNQISSLKDVITLQSLSKTLKKLTLHGNPLQTTLKKYKWVVLHHLPFLMSFDDCRVTLGDREKMDIFEQMFVKKEERGTTARLLPELMPRSQSSLGVLGQYF